MRYRALTAIITALGLAASAAGQEVVLSSDVSHAVAANPCLSFSNPAGIGTLNVGKVAEAVLSFDKDNGGLTDIDSSKDSWQGEARTESYMKYNDRTSLYGKMSWSYFRGQQMSGSALMHPQYYPVNFLESVDTCVGIKYQEAIDLEGGLSHLFNDRLTGGLKVKYEVADRTKLKDPRFCAKWMDLEFTSGVLFKRNARTTLGVDLSFVRSVESLSAKSFGTKDRQYYIFVDYGSFYGNREIFEGDEYYVSVSNTRPMAVNDYGIDFQIVRKGAFEWTHDFGYSLRDGHFGQRGSTTVTFCEFMSHVAHYNGSVISRSADNFSKISLDAEFSYSSNNENSYSKSTEPGHSTVVNYHGSNNVFSGLQGAAKLSYDRFVGVSGFRPEWEYGASATGLYRGRTTTLYPYVREQMLVQAGASLYCLRNVARTGGVLSLRADAGFAMGFDDEIHDRALASTTAKTPRSADVWLNRQSEFETAPRVSAGVGVSRTWQLASGRWVQVGVKDAFTALLSAPQYLQGSFRNAATVTVSLGL